MHDHITARVKDVALKWMTAILCTLVIIAVLVLIFVVFWLRKRADITTRKKPYTPSYVRAPLNDGDVVLLPRAPLPHRELTV